MISFVHVLPNPSKHVFIHPVAIMCKIIPQSEKTLAVNLCKKIVEKNVKSSLKEKTRYTACECYLQLSASFLSSLYVFCVRGNVPLKQGVNYFCPFAKTVIVTTHDTLAKAV